MNRPTPALAVELADAARLTASDAALTVGQRQSIASTCQRAAAMVTMHAPGCCVTESEFVDVMLQIEGIIRQTVPKKSHRNRLFRAIGQLATRYELGPGVPALASTVKGEHP